MHFMCCNLCLIIPNMNLIYKITALCIACIFCYNSYSQPRPNIVKPPKINGVLKATTVANVNAKIHANSNSVFGTSNTHPNYNKKRQEQKSEIKTEDEPKNKKAKKQKK